MILDLCAQRQDVISHDLNSSSSFCYTIFEFVDHTLLGFNQLVIVGTKRYDVFLCQLDLILDEINLMIRLMEFITILDDLFFEKSIHCAEDLYIQKIFDDFSSPMSWELHKGQIVCRA